jgi:hypothetical protein
MTSMATSLATRRAEARAPEHLSRSRVVLDDGLRTTVYVARYELARTALRVARPRRPVPLGAWCDARGIPEAMVGGFFTRPDGAPLGELRTRGMARSHTPFDAPWEAVRGCLHVEGGRPRIAARRELPDEPRGDLLQAGPVLVREGEPAIRDGKDPEGFSAAAAQFDSDITAGRYPRAVLGLSATDLIAVVSEGRSETEAGLTLAEAAGAMIALDATDAINLDGGGSASLVCGGKLVNTPREEEGHEIPGGRPICTALQFVAR